MPKEAVYQVRMDAAIKNQVEALYRSLGTSFAEAVRIFAVQSIREQGMPFTPSAGHEVNVGMPVLPSDKKSKQQEERTGN